MFDLEAAIRDWRKEAQRRWAGDRPALDELEDHLREEFARLTASGHSVADAWSMAISKLGDPVEISKEFAKLGRLTIPDRIVLGLFVGAAPFAVVAVTKAIVVPEQPLRDLYLGLFAIGCLSGLFAAAVAGYGTIRSVFAREPILPLTQATLRLVQVSSFVAATLTVLGFGLGIVSAASEGELGSMFRAGDHQIRPILVSIYFIAAAAITRKTGIAPRIALAVALGGGGAFFAIWFGATVFSTRHFHPWHAIVGFGGFIACIALAALSLTVRDISTSTS
jgi:hypothetical protein